MNAHLSATRLILYHKQATSARTLFVRFNDTVCAFEPLPADAQLLEQKEDQLVVAHPAALVNQAEKHLGLANGDLEIETEFQKQVSVPAEGMTITIYLVRFTAIDPPFQQLAQYGGRFISIMDAKDLPRTELELLRHAYAVIMEG